MPIILAVFLHLDSIGTLLPLANYVTFICALQVSLPLCWEINTAHIVLCLWFLSAFQPLFLYIMYVCVSYLMSLTRHLYNVVFTWLYSGLHTIIVERYLL